MQRYYELFKRKIEYTKLTSRTEVEGFDLDDFTMTTGESEEEIEVDSGNRKLCQALDIGPAFPSSSSMKIGNSSQALNVKTNNGENLRTLPSFEGMHEYLLNNKIVNEQLAEDLLMITDSKPDILTSKDCDCKRLDDPRR